MYEKESISKNINVKFGQKLIKFVLQPCSHSSNTIHIHLTCVKSELRLVKSSCLLYNLALN